MNVLWIQDYLRPDGGAEQSNKAVVHVGESLGFDIVGMSPRNFAAELFQECDLVVLNNFHHFSGAQTQAVLYALLEGRVPYIVYSHDYRDLKRRDFARPLYENSLKNIFISPKHLEDYRTGLGIDGVAIPLCIDVNGFKPDSRISRKPKSALVVAPQKQGTECKQFITKHARDYEFSSLGQRMQGCGKAIIRQRLLDMPGIYSAFDLVLHMPQGLCAGERVIFEAALCGCKIVSNKNAGHMSWGWDLSDRPGLVERLEQAPFTFWRLVEDLLS